MVTQELPIFCEAEMAGEYGIHLILRGMGYYHKVAVTSLLWGALLPFFGLLSWQWISDNIIRAHLVEVLLHHTFELFCRIPHVNIVPTYGVEPGVDGFSPLFS